MKTRDLIALACLMLVSVSGVVHANFQEGVAAYESGKFVRAAEIWKVEAENGDPAAQRNLGLLYLAGQGVPKNARRAADWFAKAAEQGFGPAAANLANLYLRGEGVDRDLDRSFEYLRIAADGGLAEAQHNLGIYYEHGVGTNKDEDAALFWYRRAASGGFEASAKRIAELRPDEAPVVVTSEEEEVPAENRQLVATAPVGDGLMDRLVTLFQPSE